MALRRCLDCGTPTKASHCPTCRQRRYGAQHKARRAALLAASPRCHWCGTAPATIADHLDPRDVDGPLVPACHACNTSRGSRRDGRAAR